MLKNKDFTLLLIGRFITNFGDSLYLIATMSLVYAMTGSTFYTGVALFLTSITALIQVLLSPLLDRIDMKRFLIASQLLQGLLLLVIPLLHATNQLRVEHILIAMPMISLINQIVYPGQLALLPRIVDSRDLIKANSLFAVAYQGSDTMFNAIGGTLLAAIGFVSAYYIDSATFLINAGLFAFLSRSLSERKKSAADGDPIRRHFRELKSGLRFWNNPTLKPLLIGGVALNFAATAVFSTLPAFASGSAFYGILLSAMGSGALLGSLLANLKLLRKVRMGTLYIGLIACAGFAWSSLAFVDRSDLIGKAIVFSAFLVGWIAIGVLNIYSQTFVQTTVPREQVGIALSSMIGLSVALAPLGALTSGLLSRHLGTESIILLACSLILLVAVYWMISPSLRRQKTMA